MVWVVGLGAREDDGERGGSGEEQVRALGDDADGGPGSHLHRHAVAAVHHAAYHPDLERGDKGVSPRGLGRRRAGARHPLMLQGDWGTWSAPLVERATLNLEVVSSSPTLGVEMTSKQISKFKNKRTLEGNCECKRAASSDSASPRRSIILIPTSHLCQRPPTVCQCSQGGWGRGGQGHVLTSGGTQSCDSPGTPLMTWSWSSAHGPAAKPAPPSGSLSSVLDGISWPSVSYISGAPGWLRRRSS